MIIPITNSEPMTEEVVVRLENCRMIKKYKVTIEIPSTLYKSLVENTIEKKGLSGIQAGVIHDLRLAHTDHIWTDEEPKPEQAYYEQKCKLKIRGP